MNDLNTISVENRAKRQQLQRERLAEEKRKRQLREKRRRERMIKYYAVCTALILFLLLVIFIIFTTIFCSNGDTKENKPEPSTPIVEEAFNPSLYTFTEDMYIYENSEAALEMLENLKASKVELGKKIQFIIDNEAAYPEMLIKLVAKSPETIDFAIEYPFKKGMSDSIFVDISTDYTQGKIPLLLQWDDRWGYVAYGKETISLSGCGPTCLSMVAVGLTGNTKWTPVRTARMAYAGGYYVEGMGTDWSLMYDGCKQMGLSAKEIGLSEELMVAQLNAGHPMIVSVGPGDFTDNGHFIVITGYENGAFTINDPNSIKNSSRTWLYEDIKSQIKNIWAYSLAD